MEVRSTYNISFHFFYKANKNKTKQKQTILEGKFQQTNSLEDWGGLLKENHVNQQVIVRRRWQSNYSS